MYVIGRGKKVIRVGVRAEKPAGNLQLGGRETEMIMLNDRQLQGLDEL